MHPLSVELAHGRDGKEDDREYILDSFAPQYFVYVTLTLSFWGHT
jgi:hypothetical protein